jgi:hypothetical protein
MSTIETWAADVAYQPGSLVTHQGAVYQKLDDGDQSEPDGVAGGWQLLVTSNVAEYNAIAQSFASYEARVQAHQSKMTAAKRSAMGKLAALGLTADEINALGLATT